jgi:hypothetical protein
MESGRLRPLKVLAYFALGISASLAVLILLKASARPPAPAAVPTARLDEARRVLAELKRKAEKQPDITDALIAEIHVAGNRWNSTLAEANPGEASPFDHLAGSLVTRRAEIAAETFAAVQVQVDRALRARKYAAALNTLAEYHPYAPLEEARRGLVAQVLAAVDADLAAVEDHGAALVEAGRFAEAARWFTQQAGRFRGTDRHVRVNSRPETLVEISTVEDLRRRRESQEAQARADEALRKILAPPPAAAAAPGSAPESPAALALNPFLAKIAERVNQGRFKDKKYEFGAGVNGSPAAATPEALGVGGAKIPWAGVPLDVLFAMANDTFHAEDWILATEYAYGAGHPAQAEKFLWRYAGADRQQRQPKIDEILARMRGVKGVPEGGYTYDAKNGWEDRFQRANRTAVDEASRLGKTLLSATDVRKREETFEKLRALYLQPGLSDIPRDKVRGLAVEALVALKKDRIEDLGKKAKSSAGLEQLRALRLVLKERREEALKVIYDPKIYLPEDDPRWRQGDKVNGQERVDELVEAVKQVWDAPAQTILTASRSIERDLEEIRTINEKFFPAFGLESESEKDLAAFEELRNNLNERLSVKSYSLNAADRQDYEWNRRVDQYNANLKEAGITQDEIEHARTVNDYREMMGRRRLFLDARLCRATKKHSAVCARAGRIWHVGEDGDPQSRARAEGFSASVSENVAIGYSSPSDIWTRGWYRASDHHRNGLNDSWNTIGYGYSGNVGTENFSSIGTPRGF